MKTAILRVAIVLGVGPTPACHLRATGDSDTVASAKAAPLARFASGDGRYFPDFINAFFPNARTFTSSHSTLARARERVVMIEVKPLNIDPVERNEANLSWSADGVYLGFELFEGAYRKIMLKDLAGGFARELRVIPKGPENFLDGMVTKSAHSYNAGLRWSRDSARFAFMSNGGVGVYNIYVGAVGADERPIAPSPTKDGYATWSPATNEISFVSARSGNGDIYTVDIGSQAVTRLSSSDAVDIFPEWFPGAHRIVFSSGDATDHDLVVVERAGTNQQWSRPYPLTDWTRDDLRPTVSPDGRFVAFYADQGVKSVSGEMHWNIHVVPFVPGRTYSASDLERMVVASDVMIDLNTGPAWAPDSRKIFFVKRDVSAANPVEGYDLYTGVTYIFQTGTRLNRDLVMSRLGVLSFRAQVGAWDRVFLALTNQGIQLQESVVVRGPIQYLDVGNERRSGL